MTGIELIAKERQEQIEKHGRTIEYDASQNIDGQLAHAASVLSYPYHYADDIDDTPYDWNIDLFKKMRNKPRIEQLVIAGALIAAEIDRLKAQ